MSEYLLKNEKLTITVNDLGAELTSLLDPRTNTEYLWNADPAYWKRYSPVLFPFVGSLQNKSYQDQGVEYSMSQHGFARDMVFTLKEQRDNTIWFYLEATEETLNVYPYPFVLEIGYELTDRKVKVLWKVTNPGTNDLHFSLGAHPGFMCPLHSGEEQSDYYIGFDTNQPLHYMLINEKGLLQKKPFEAQDTLMTDSDGFLPIRSDLFDRDALIIEQDQSHRVFLAGPDRKPYLGVSFEAPLFGLWSPAKKNAPFVCIEPWYGRCDSAEFHGTLKERDYTNHLAPGQIFEAAYEIEIIK